MCRIQYLEMIIVLLTFFIHFVVIKNGQVLLFEKYYFFHTKNFFKYSISVLNYLMCLIKYE